MLGRRQKRLDAAICRGRRLRSEDRDRESLEFLDEARLEFPREAEFQLLYATTLLALRPEDVALEVAKAVGLAPDDPTVLVCAANLSIQTFESFARDLAVFLADRGRLVEALGVVDQALPRVKTERYLEVLREQLVAAIDSGRSS